MKSKPDNKIIKLKETKKFIVLKCYNQFGSVLVLKPPILTFPNIDVYSDMVQEWLEVFIERGYEIK